jgi:hypothetical protein
MSQLNSEAWTDDQIYNRLLQNLPPWFGSAHKNLDVQLQAMVVVASYLYSFVEYAAEQTRLQTCTDSNLDLFASDYFGIFLKRKSNENDDSYRTRISALLLQPRVTREAIKNNLYLLTGYEPIMFEPGNAYDCFALNMPQYGGLNVGLLGNQDLAYQGFIDVFVDSASSLGGYGGLGCNYFGLNSVGQGALNFLGNESLITNTVTDQDIYNTINLSKLFGTVVWVNIERI